MLQSDNIYKSVVPQFQPLRKIMNKTAEDLKVEILFEEVQVWCPLIPCVSAYTEYDMVILLRLPRTSQIRTVNIKTGKVYMNHGSMTNGLSLIIT